MSDFGTNKYYPPRFQGNIDYPGHLPVIGDVNEKANKVDQAKNRAQDTNAGKFLNELANEQSPMDTINNFLYGLAAFIPMVGFNKWLSSGETFEQSRIKRAMNWVDRKVQNSFLRPVDNFFQGIGRRIKNFAPVKHFVGNKETVQPLNSFARGASRTLQGDLINEVLTKTKDLYAEKGREPFRQILANADGQRNTWEAFKNWLGFSLKGDYRKAAEEVKGKIGNTDFSALPYKDQRRYAGALKKYQEALKTNDQRKIARAARGFIKKATKTMGEYNANAARELVESFKLSNISRDSRHEYYKKMLRKLGGLAGISNVDDLIKTKGDDKAMAEILKKLGLGELDDIAVKSNKARFLMDGKGATFLSKGLKGLYTMNNRLFSGGPFNLLGVYFVGNVIRKTIEAKKGERLSTFMEGTAQELLPFWVMMNAVTRMPYNIIGGLKTAGKEAQNRFVRVATAPARWTGNLLGMGLDGKLTHKMDAKDAEKLIKDPAALKRFNELKQMIKEGKGGPKNFLGRLASFDLKFWKGAGPAWKEMRGLFKQNVGFFKRAGIRLKSIVGGGTRFGIILTLIPLVGSVLTKVSHKIFGKPSTTKEKEEAEKAKAEAEKQAQQNQVDSTGPVQSGEEVSPYVREYLDKNRGTAPTQNTGAGSPYTNEYLQHLRENRNQQNTGLNRGNNPAQDSSMLDSYLERFRNNLYQRSNQSIPSSKIRNDNVPASKLGSAEDYFAVPEPITTSPETTSRVNLAVSEVDKVIKETQQTLQKL